jgi:bifunctional non-homologous end joining protein LigD
MLVTLVDAPFDDKTWVFETKWDGFRLITENRGDTVRLWSRNGIDVTTRYAVLLPALHARLLRRRPAPGELTCGTQPTQSRT